MNDEGDPSSFFSTNFDEVELSDTKTNAEDLEILPPPFPLNQWYDCNMLVRAQMSQTFLERQSLISFVETDGEYIVTAGRDHEINVWNAVDGNHERRLLGHGGPVTGLHLYSWKQASPPQRVIFSSSEDGSIRKWSLEEGGKTSVFWTGNVITCMGVMDNHGDPLAVTGNSKGIIEVRRLATGELYSTVLGHLDPIDALVVDGYFACSAIFDDTSSVKVWQMKCLQITCIHNIESTPETEFCSVAICGTKVLLGAFDGQTLQVIDFKTGEKELVNLGNCGCKVEHIRVWNNWIFSCSSGKKYIVLDVRRMDDYQHFGTFSCNMNQACAVAAMECESSLKIVLGGSALVVLDFYFNPMQEVTKTTTGRLIDQETLNLTQNKKKGHFTMKEYLADEKHNESTDSDESSSSAEETTTTEKPYEGDLLSSSLVTVFEVPDVKLDNYRTQIAEFWADTEESKKPDGLPECSKPPFKQVISTNPATLISEQRIFDRVSQYAEEPRMVIRRLEKILDESNELGETEEKAKTTERPKTCTEVIDDIIKKHYDTSDEDFHAEIGTDSGQIKESKNDNVNIRTQEEKPNDTKLAPVSNENNPFIEKFENLKIPEVENDKKTKSEKRKSFFNRCKRKKSNKTITQKSGHKKCEIM